MEQKLNLIPAIIVTLIAYAFANNAQANTCDWNNPGANRYTGNQAEALNNYKDIPQEIRTILKEKINAHQYDDHITISRIGMVGKQNYANGRDMHWGQNKMCKGEFNISKWNYMHTENALVYTYKGYSIAIPSVCGNVFRLDLMAGGNLSTGGSGIPEKENFVPTVTPTEPEQTPEVEQGGSTPFQSSTVPTVNWPSDKPQQNGLVPDRGREFMPAPPMPITPAFVFVKPQDPIVSIPVVPAVPEPSTYALMLLGLCVVVGLSQKNKK